MPNAVYQDVMQSVYQHAFLADVTHNPQHSTQNLSFKHAVYVYNSKITVNYTQTHTDTHTYIFRLHRMYQQEGQSSRQRWDEEVCPNCMHTTVCALHERLQYVGLLTEGVRVRLGSTG